MTIIQKSLAKVLFKNLASVVCICALFVLTGVSCQQASPEASDTQVSALARGAITAPTPIYDQSGLEAIDSNPSGSYILVNSITLTGLTPICDPDSGYDPFTGILDGDGFTILVESFASGALDNNPHIGIFAESGASALFKNLTVNLATDPLTINTAQYAGGLVAYAEGTTFDNITVNGEFVVTFTGPRPPSPSSAARKPAKGADNYHALLPGITAPEGFSVGGVAGYAGVSTIFNAITTELFVNAASRNSTVFAGGAVGFAEDSTISASRNSGDIRADGPGYNTSAGGIAGYIEHTTVTYSSSGGAISANATGGAADWDDSWQIDAGGLVGYSGGNPNGKSLITNSHATGNVTSTGPFPYAGGLVGYNYGYSIFVPTPASGNGSIVSQSYATGNVTAISETQTSSTGPYGNIPYAGGLAGYNSMVGSTIEDSYARGNVTATTPGTYSWAGGVVGGNANNAVVTRTYSTGDVVNRVGDLDPLSPPYNGDVPGPASGGIAGFNYYTDETVVSYSVALNSLIDTNNTDQDVVHRVVGHLGNTSGFTGTLNDNLAYDGMTVNNIVKPDPGTDRRDGGDTVAQPDQSVYAGLKWNFTDIWTIGNDGYPALLK
jgi:hypothetical protein